MPLEALRHRLRAHRPFRVPLARHMRRAAVAAVLRDAGGDPELLLIRRAEHPGDPWSGHMAFPGGRLDPTDADALAAALRETREELDLDLGPRAALLGPLSQIPTWAHGRPLPMVVAPFVFELLGEPPPLHPSDEVAEALWIPLGFFAERRHRERMAWRVAGLSVGLPCYRYQGRVIWGLTLRMIDELVRLGSRSSP